MKSATSIAPGGKIRSASSHDIHPVAPLTTDCRKFPRGRKFAQVHNHGFAHFQIPIRAVVSYTTAKGHTCQPFPIYQSRFHADQCSWCVDLPTKVIGKIDLDAGARLLSSDTSRPSRGIGTCPYPPDDSTNTFGRHCFTLMQPIPLSP